MAIRAKMVLDDVVQDQWGGKRALFVCRYDPNRKEDQSFQKATPTGTASFQIDNPAATAQLVIGREYYFDITEVPAE